MFRQDAGRQTHPLNPAAKVMNGRVNAVKVDAGIHARCPKLKAPPMASADQTTADTGNAHPAVTASGDLDLV